MLRSTFEIQLGFPKMLYFFVQLLINILINSFKVEQQNRQNGNAICKETVLNNSLCILY